MWTAAEIREQLSNTVEEATGGATQAGIFMHHYGVKEQGNVQPEQVEYLTFLYKNTSSAMCCVERKKYFSFKRGRKIK